MPAAHGASAPPATNVGTGPARVLIVDDSVVARAVIGRALEHAGAFTVAGAVSDVRAALSFLRAHHVDLILLDIEMPGMDGLTALPDILAAGDGAKVVIVSSSAGDGGIATIQALALGAADTLEKPVAGASLNRFGELLEQKLRRLVAPESVPGTPSTPGAAVRDAGGAFDIVAIGASTGGIHALSHVLRALTADFSLPILITQHLPASFMPYFAAQIAVLAGRPCSVADDHSRIVPGRILVAPGHAHIRCVRLGEGAALRLDTRPSISGCLPSVDPMFDSVAQVYGARALGLVLSGMGRDGAEGAAAMVRAGGSIIAQDKQSSVVWGMPGAVVASGLASAVLDPERIGRAVMLQRRLAC